MFIWKYQAARARVVGVSQVSEVSRVHCVGVQRA